jgi:hypothetical protein
VLETLNRPAPAAAPLMPPAADVPGYQHVFLFYFENENYSQVVGNTKQAPYLNSLRGHGATLKGLSAERERLARRHRARLLLERRPADDVLPERP